MASSARLERLQKLVQPDVDALPDRHMDPEPISDDNDSGGVSLENILLDLSAHAQDTPQENAASIKPSSSAAAVTTENAEHQFIWMEATPSSFNPNLDSMRISTPPPPPTTAELPVNNLQRGDLASARYNYTPIHALARYPYKFCNKTQMQDIASAFFDQGKFWKRGWDLYYVWDMDSSKPIVLVRENQVQDLLTEINNHLNLSLRITNQQREEGLLARFPDHPRCLPRYLGRSYSREDVDNMAANAPDKAYRAAGEPPQPHLQTPMLEMFKQLMESLVEVQSAKRKANNAKKQQDRLVKNKSMADQFKRAQRYLGLREPSQEQVLVQLTSSPTFDLSMPAPFAFDQSVVFVCVDVESYEKAHHKITEVGVATLDTRDLKGIPPGENGKAWREMIRARHFRINEYKHLVNSLHVIGCPDGFRFGKSTFVSLNEVAKHIAACFHAPFGAQDMPTDHSTEKRNIVFLGHDTQSDIRYLQQLGYDPIKEENILEVMDTAVMYRVWRREQQSTKLSRILNDFDIIGWKLHNAGNDAVYTVQAMLGICVREATIRGSSESNQICEKDGANSLVSAQEEAEQQAQDDRAGWSEHEAGYDSGRTLPLVTGPISNLVSAQSVLQYDGSCEVNVQAEQGSGRDRVGPGVPSSGYGCRAFDQEADGGSWHTQTTGREQTLEQADAHEPGRDRDFSYVSAGDTGSAATNVQYYW